MGLQQPWFSARIQPLTTYQSWVLEACVSELDRPEILSVSMSQSTRPTLPAFPFFQAWLGGLLEES